MAAYFGRGWAEIMNPMLGRCDQLNYDEVDFRVYLASVLKTLGRMCSCDRLDFEFLVKAYPVKGQSILEVSHTDMLHRAVSHRWAAQTLFANTQSKH